MENKVVLVTGASRGIGEAVAREFAKKHYNIVINYLNNREKAEKLKQELQEMYNIKVLTIKADVSNEKEVKDMIEQVQKEFINILNKLSVLLAYRYNEKLKNTLKKEHKEVESVLNKIEDNQMFIQELTDEKILLTNEIKKIDETINDKKDLQEEYEKRNKDLPLEEKIFSVKILSKLMLEEREEKLKRLEEINKLLNPRNFVKFKNKIQNKQRYLKLIEKENIEKEIIKCILDLQKVFLDCYYIKIKNVNSKQDLIKLIYEFRYYCLIPISEKKSISEIDTISSRN